MLCEHYWPANSTPVTHGHITIHLLAEEPEEEWTRREFQLQHVWALGDRAGGKGMKAETLSPGPHEDHKILVTSLGSVWGRSKDTVKAKD